MTTISPRADATQNEASHFIFVLTKEFLKKIKGLRLAKQNITITY